MKICYHCAWCGADMAVLDVGEVDENKLGFDCLTSEEREDIINIDMHGNVMHVKALCDHCVSGVSISNNVAIEEERTENYSIH